ncbi:MAG TPA: sigma-54 dependent transcriptional regulator [Candidatus Polarisedimenticolia bacterium]|jgi:DNA-binding NtrC family response regulator
MSETQGVTGLATVAVSAGTRLAARARLLAVDDDPEILEMERDVLTSEGYVVETALSGEQAIRMAQEDPFDIVLSDLRMPSMDGLDLLKEFAEIDPELPVIILTGHGDIASAVDSIKQGAYDYLTKPLHVHKLVITVEKALERRQLRASIDLLQKQIHGRDRLGALIGTCPPMQQIFQKIDHVAPTNSTVLILGESGTGKEMVAKEIHRMSPRHDKPFVALSCSNLPQTLLESELFGHERGSFTGATACKPGLFEAAQGGTIFLDEIASTSIQTQAGLLRVLQEREVRRVGSNLSRKVDVRVVAATNLDLDRAMEEGAFRADLYYRLSSVVLMLPKLSGRVEDIPLLAAHFLQKACENLRKPPRRLSPRAMELLTGYSWPGNVRELENVIEHAVIFSPREVIRPKDLSRSVAGLLRDGHPDTLVELEKRHIGEILKRTSGNKVHAARILGIPRSSLYRKIKRFDLAQ